MFIEDLVDDIGVWEAYFRMRRLYLRTPIPESTDKDRGIVSGRHHRAMKVADRPAFAGAPGLAASEFRLEQLKDRPGRFRLRSEEHTSELQSLMRISYAVICLQQKTL